MATTASKITRNRDICGGDACVEGTRIPVWVLVNYKRLGASDQDILHAYPSLTPGSLDAVWEYATRNVEEIDRAISENEEGDAGLVE